MRNDGKKSPTCPQHAPMSSDLLVRRVAGGGRGRLVTVSPCDAASVRLSDEPFSPAVYSGDGEGEERREGRGRGEKEEGEERRKRREGRGREGRGEEKPMRESSKRGGRRGLSQSHYWMRLCCVPGSGTAMAPSLLENHRKIFTDGRGGKKILHLGVRV